jgi:hypothetical protein
VVFLVEGEDCGVGDALGALVRGDVRREGGQTRIGFPGHLLLAIVEEEELISFCDVNFMFFFTHDVGAAWLKLLPAEGGEVDIVKRIEVVLVTCLREGYKGV